MPILQLDAVRFAYDGLDMCFDLDVAEGAWIAVIGPSGAGKSTLLDLVAGFVGPDSGRILYRGADMSGMAPSERPVSLVFQENNLFPHLTALQNVLLGLTTRARPGAPLRARAEEALAAVGLAGYGPRRPAAMSGGERQRVALARALVRERPLLLLDEPFAALGPGLRQDMLGLIGQLRERARLTILMVTHQPEDALGHAERIVFIDKGRVALDGPVAELMGPPPHPRLADYLS
ncbi:thiamine ABC transporter ATP-binding protein [Aureimonas frigidaquae]|uniref:Putative ATP-binding protein, ABC-type thiamine transporter n=1 Tax=Aureimonas frigidaquae TaxID=424757 RepID=A0A0P0Z1Z5_9HYPH|nr:ATP-binding cassette domain-containing protein [Aureimonas frigidaquae]BAT27886.1 putative ATP-binding protein, ABC-type thiamine transporter [Aureimonas frigidaquae]